MEIHAVSLEGGENLLMRPLVAIQTGLLREAFLTEPAPKWPLARVQPLVGLEMPRNGEGFAAEATHMGPYASMASLVTLQRGLPSEGLDAELALERALAGVSCFVRPKVGHGLEALVANLATEAALRVCCPHVLVQLPHVGQVLVTLGADDRTVGAFLLNDWSTTKNLRRAPGIGHVGFDLSIAVGDVQSVFPIWRPHDPLIHRWEKVEGREERGSLKEKGMMAHIVN